MEVIKKPNLFVIAVALFGAVFGEGFLAAAVTVPPGGLVTTRSGRDVVLWFATTSPNFYIAQSSPDLIQWTNTDPGLPGNGAVEAITITNALARSQGFYRMMIETPSTLILPQGTAFAILGYSCGGIQEHVSAGFDVTNGYPTGVVDLSTTCGGSGVDGGGHTTTHTASALVTWDFAGNVLSATAITNGVTVDPTTPTDGQGGVIYGIGANAYLVVPVPSSPTDVAVDQSNDQFQVSWTPHGVNPNAIISSTLTATPVQSSAPVLITTVAGDATSGIIPTLQPQTTYQVTVMSRTIGGMGQASAPVSVTTSPATIPPSAPTSVVANWPPGDPSGTTDTLTAIWSAPNPGNSPIDQYLISITGSDGAGTYTQTVPGTTLTAYFTVDYIPNWSVTVQAHNAAGWGPVSATYTLGGL